MIDQTLETALLKTLTPYNQLYLGFSGGLDSSVLLHLLAGMPTLSSKLKAIHVNHGLSPNASSWEKHCQQFCQDLQIPLSIFHVKLDRRRNLEEAARNARYAIFRSCIQSNDCLVTGHHQDDQAETLLLHLFRGTGIEGLAAMKPLSQIGQGNLLRPLLSVSRKSLKAYALQHQFTWIEDESNVDPRFSRNFLRHKIFPLLEEKWPGVTANLERTTRHSQQAQANLNDLARIDSPAIFETARVLPLDGLSHLSLARISNVFRTWLKHHGVRMPPAATFERLLTEMLGAGDDANPQVEWDDICIRRYQQKLYLEPRYPLTIPPCLSWLTFPQPLVLPQGQGFLEAVLSSKGILIHKTDNVDVRFREGGESFIWHGQTKALKKLMQTWQIPPWLRPQIPLIYVNDRLAAVAGYAISEDFYGEHIPDVFQVSFQPALNRAFR